MAADEVDLGCTHATKYYINYKQQVAGKKKATTDLMQVQDIKKLDKEHNEVNSLTILKLSLLLILLLHDCW